MAEIIRKHLDSAAEFMRPLDDASSAKYIEVMKAKAMLAIAEQLNNLARVVGDINTNK